METPLNNEEIETRLTASLPEWRLVDRVLKRTVATPDWRVTMLAANAVGFLAEAAHHHPEMTLRYRSLEIRLWTTDVGGVTEKDFALAAQIEAVLRWPQGAGTALDGPPARWLDVS